jgi:hypothetical protein
MPGPCSRRRRKEADKRAILAGNQPPYVGGCYFSDTLLNKTSDMNQPSPQPGLPAPASPEAGLTVAARQLCELLGNIHPPTLQAAVDENPANYARLVATLLMLAEWQLKQEQHRAEMLEAEARKQKELEALHRPPGITPEVIEKIERDLKLF